jgi:hypothetical protein
VSKNKFLLWPILLLTACAGAVSAHAPQARAAPSAASAFVRQPVPNTQASLLVPQGWVTEADADTVHLASSSRNFFYAPDASMEGVLIQLFVSDAPRTAGPAFDLLRLAQAFAARQALVTQAPALWQENDRAIASVLYAADDSRGAPFTYLAGFVVHHEVLTVFLAATPQATQAAYLPVLDRMLRSIQVTPPSGL